MNWIALLPLSDADALPLAWQALRFTPRVCLVDEAVLLEVSGSERLWGGWERLLGLICEQKVPLRHDRWSQGATSLVAIAFLRLGVTGLDAAEGAIQAVLNRLPLHALTAANDALPMLHRAGCRTWGDLRALPRAGVARRFGVGLLQALDQAYGEQPESHYWLSLPEQFEQSIELLSLAESAPMLMFGAQRLLTLLRAWLQGRHLGVLTLELRWRYDLCRIDGVDLPTHGQLQLRTAEPTQDMAHLGRLMAENLARNTLAAPVNALTLRATDTAPLPTVSASLLPSDGAVEGDSLHQLVERLSARLGGDHVLCAVSQADHRPECRQRWVPAAQNRLKQGTASRTGIPGAFYPSGGSAVREATRVGDMYLPTWLLREPLVLQVHGNRPHYQGPLRLLVGPQRLETGWWLDDSDRGDAGQSEVVKVGLALRDYFIAHSTHAGLLWVYRQRLGPANAAEWFLQGLYA